MPRLRNWKGLTFYRPSKQSEYVHIDALFGEPGKNVIDWDLIESQFRHLMRVAVSVREGAISSATLLKRLRSAEERHLHRVPRGWPRHPHRAIAALPLRRAASPAGDGGDEQGQVVQPVLSSGFGRPPRRHRRQRSGRAGEDDEVQRPADQRGHFPATPWTSPRSSASCRRRGGRPVPGTWPRSRRT